MEKTSRLARHLAMTGLLLAAGCGTDSQDARLAEVAGRSLDAQARQNERMAHLGCGIRSSCGLTGTVGLSP